MDLHRSGDDAARPETQPKRATMNAAATVRTVTTRVGAKRTMSTTPKMHKAKDVWHKIQETRPPEGHPHVSCRWGSGLRSGGGGEGGLEDKVERG